MDNVLSVATTTGLLTPEQDSLMDIFPKLLLTIFLVVFPKSNVTLALVDRYTKEEAQDCLLGFSRS